MKRDDQWLETRIFTLQELSVKSSSCFDVPVAACATDFVVVNFIFDNNIKQYPMEP